MKKIALMALALTTVSAFGWEVNVKTGYDFYRGGRNVTTDVTKVDDVLGNGWTLGAEVIPFNKGVVELGVGTEYNFGTTKARFSKYEKQPDGSYKETEEQAHHFAPIYALAKVNLFRSEDNNSSAYALARFGGVVYGTKDAGKDTYTNRGGVYYGAGLGFDYGHFLVEGLYDGAYLPKTDKADAEFINKVGVRVGFKFGDYKVVKPVVVEEAPAPAPVEIVEPVAPKVVRPTKVETKTKFIHAMCDAEAKKCVIHGFKIDGRKPNKKESKDLGEVVKLLNDFADSGTIDIVGHTDSTGSDKYNQKLSVIRAQEVNKLLTQYGLKSEYKINSVSGKGEKEPMATNKTKTGRTLNRRVELLFSEMVR